MLIAPIVQLDGGVLPSGDQFWVDAATAAVRRFCGWHITPVALEDLILDGTGTQNLLVPSLNILNVLACTNDGIDVLDSVEWSAYGSLVLRTGWTRRKRGVRVTVEHGYEDAPDVAGIIVDIAARMASSAGVMSQSTGPFAVRYSPGRMPLLPDEKASLEPYRIVSVA